MRKPSLQIPCDLCRSKVAFGGGHYDGHTLPHYDMFLCHRCYSMNWDGIAPLYEPIFEKHLSSKGIPLPRRNAQGWYPR